MRERFAAICSLIEPCHVFADVGCDHGFMAQYVLEHGLCRKVYITDVSAPSLKKAETLLSPYILEGKCVPVVSDGLDGIKEKCDFVLIAGMGGEEIVKILSRVPLPPRFLLQPMKNTERVRAFLLERGAAIERDFTVAEGGKVPKYYDILLGRAEGGDVYTARERRYGRDNLRGASIAFLRQMREEAEKIRLRLTRPMQEKSRLALEAALSEKEEIIHGLEGIIQGDR